MFKKGFTTTLLYIAIVSVFVPLAARAYTFTNQLDYGDRGADVSALQQVLKDLTFFTYPDITGFFGSVTQTAVQAFQSAKNIVSSGTPETTGYGRIGPATIAALNGESSTNITSTTTSTTFNFSRDLQLHDMGEDVRELQKFLNKNGFLVATTGAGSPDNETDYFGPATLAALAAFQTANGIEPPAGFFGPLTRAKVVELTISAKPDTTTSTIPVPDYPQSFHIEEARSYHIVLGWDAVEGATSYTIKRKSENDNAYFTIGTATTTTFTDINVSSRIFYSYVVTASNAGGESSPSSVIAALARSPGGGGGGSSTQQESSNSVPSNTSLPVVSGTETEGQTLTASTGSWSGTPTPSYTYQWKADGTAIPGATNATYVLTTDEVSSDISVSVTATNSEGSALATSASTDSIAAKSTLAGGPSLLTDEDAGFAADFTYATKSQQVTVKGNTSGNGNYAPNDLFTAAGTSPKIVHDSTGSLVWAPHNIALYSEDFTQTGTWTQSGSPVVTADTIQDNNASAASFIAQSFTLIQGAEYTFTFNVEKDSNTSVFPSFYILSSTQAFISINTQTCAASDAESNTIGATYSSTDEGTYCSVSITFTAGAAGSSLRIYPARSSSLGGSADNSAVRTMQINSVQLNRGDTATEYLTTTSSIRYGLAEDYDPSTNESRGILIENFSRTNLLLNTYTDLVTQDVTVSATPYTLSFYGTGTVTLSGVSSAGPLVGTGADDRVTLTFTPSAGTLTLTVSGTVSYAQLEAGSNASSPIPTYAAAIARGSDQINIAVSSILDLGSEWSVYLDFVYTTPTVSTQYIFNMANGLNERTSIRIDNTTPLVLIRDDSADQASISLPTIAADTREQVTVRFKENLVAASVNGAPIKLAQDTSATMPTPTTLYLGSWFNGNGPTGSFWLRRVVIVPRSLSNSEISNWRYATSTSNDIYDIFLVAGQSNTNSGETLDSGIDVSGGSVFQMSHAGAVSAADEPLNHPFVVADSIGFALPFARDYYVPNALSSGHNVLLLPSGVGNTGFYDNRWNVDDDLYNTAESITAVALAKYPNSSLKGILWMQGERDTEPPYTQSQYAAALDAMIVGFRSSFGNKPFIVGGMVPGWVAADGDRQGVQDALEDTPDRVSNTGYADPSSPTVLGSTNAHYDASAQRSFGERFWTAYSELTE